MTSTLFFFSRHPRLGTEALVDPKELKLFMYFKRNSLQSPVKILENGPSFEQPVVENSQHSQGTRSYLDPPVQDVHFTEMQIFD